ncbi:MAG TPA: PQQ-binding-like beta-propeller repeat protein [Gemmatimonadales bacterium]
MQAQVDWPRFHFDNANSGYNPYESVIGTANVSSLTQAWTYRSGAVYGSSALVQGKLYVSGSRPTDVTVTTALNAATGAVIWTHKTPHAGQPTSVTYDSGLVFFGASDYAMHALDANTGKKRWSFPTSGFPTTPVVSGGLVYFGAGLGLIYALDERTGVQMWAYQDPSYEILGGAAVSGGLVFEGDFAGRLLALDAATGVKVWSHATGEEIDESPTVADGIVYVGSRAPYQLLGYLNAIDAATGALLWKQQLGQQTFSTPAVANGVVYMGSGTADSLGELYAFDALSGTPLWTASIGDYQGAPEVANGLVYVTGGLEGPIYALDASDGTELWSFTTGGKVAEPVIANGMVYAGSFDNNLYAFSLPGGPSLGPSG